MKIIKRGGFREQAARQLKYKNSVNQRADITAQKVYQPAHHTDEVAQDTTTPPDSVPLDNMDAYPVMLPLNTMQPIKASIKIPKLSKNLTNCQALQFKGITISPKKMLK